MIAFIAKALDRMQAEHTIQIKMLTRTFEQSIDTITSKFILQIERQHMEQTKFNEEHSHQLRKVKE